MLQFCFPLKIQQTWTHTELFIEAKQLRQKSEINKTRGPSLTSSLALIRARGRKWFQDTVGRKVDIADEKSNNCISSIFVS